MNKCTLLPMAPLMHGPYIHTCIYILTFTYTYVYVNKYAYIYIHIRTHT
jgi:hypothetical protein